LNVRSIATNSRLGHNGLLSRVLQMRTGETIATQPTIAEMVGYAREAHGA